MKSRTIRLNFSGFSMNMKWLPPSFSSKISIFDPRTCRWIHACDFQGTTLTRPPTTSVGSVMRGMTGRQSWVEWL